MNLGPVVWFWRGLKGYSVTFAALFASFVLGASIMGGVSSLLVSLGVHWLYVLLLPGFFFAWMAKKEPRWLPDEKKRRRIARATLLGSIVLAVLITWLHPPRREVAPPPDEPASQPPTAPTY
ncbi:MAG: hypothetical protein PHQ04_02300 [Opitutaceae bacterium]|nr:hypothetical protein [Opitutaceae bacterium]